MTDPDISRMDGEIYGKLLFVFKLFNSYACAADPPIKDIHTFIGTFTSLSNIPTRSRSPSPTTNTLQEVELAQASQHDTLPLTAENVLWANTVLASSTALCFVIYTGKETRAKMNTSSADTKWGKIEEEINRLSKAIFCLISRKLADNKRLNRYCVRCHSHWPSYSSH